MPPIAETDAELIVLTGDIDTDLQGLEWAASVAGQLGKPTHLNDVFEVRKYK